ncbi:hypothetical protein, partial [Streptococcus parasuis]|uniref:hypothetical protein n=1 Tax=Streptococcus parasuis TaxID=1501662 RepID=UPI001A938414
DNRDKKKNTDSSAGFHQNQLESICVFYLLASFCPASFMTYFTIPTSQANQYQTHRLILKL